MKYRILDQGSRVLIQEQHRFLFWTYWATLTRKRYVLFTGDSEEAPVNYGTISVAKAEIDKRIVWNTRYVTRNIINYPD